MLKIARPCTAASLSFQMLVFGGLRLPSGAATSAKCRLDDPPIRSQSEVKVIRGFSKVRGCQRGLGFVWMEEHFLFWCSERSSGLHILTHVQVFFFSFFLQISQKQNAAADLTNGRLCAIKMRLKQRRQAAA